MSRALEIIRIPEPVAYAEMLERQYERRNAVFEGKAPNTLYLLEHPPTITLGRNTDEKHLLLSAEAYAERGIEVVEVDRGGDVTYHGPGQLVAYPILNLNEWKLSVGWYLRNLEITLIRLLKGYGLEAEQEEGYTGVWVNGAKVAAIGIGVHRWISYHGISLNVAPDMKHFEHIIPCGISDKPVCSLAQLLGEVPGMEEVEARFVDAFKEGFEI